ncbi:MAG: plasmid stabilization protein [Spiribacter salinus]|uniref:Plasmid stabilization protein n=1 Tax=Spiribacter salinus TaxID=1335746 RepID=A0A540VTW7_9GAMM|nr:MAG: plasmid stabilization protein [Spiribacter salinus]
MASITIRNLDEELKQRLQVEAARHGHSMEEEVRLILRGALGEKEAPSNIGSRIRGRFSGVIDSAFETPSRMDGPRPADFSG